MKGAGENVRRNSRLTGSIEERVQYLKAFLKAAVEQNSRERKADVGVGWVRRERSPQVGQGCLTTLHVRSQQGELESLLGIRERRAALCIHSGEPLGTALQRLESVGPTSPDRFLPRRVQLSGEAGPGRSEKDR